MRCSDLAAEVSGGRRGLETEEALDEPRRAGAESLSYYPDFIVPDENEPGMPTHPENEQRRVRDGRHCTL